MIRYFLSLLILIAAVVHTTAQTPLKSGTLVIASLPSSLPGSKFLVTGTYSDVTGQSFASDVDTSMYMWKGVHIYKLDSIYSRVGQIVTFRVIDTQSSGFISTGTALIAKPGPGGAVGVSATGEFNAAYLTPPDYAAVTSYNMNKIAAASIGTSLDSGRVAFGDGAGVPLVGDAGFTFASGALSAPRFLSTGTGGNGYFELPSQSATPSTPASGFRQFADATGRFSWKPQSDGFVRTFNGTLTADRVYSLQNSSGTFGLLESTQTWTGLSNTFSSIGGDVLSVRSTSTSYARILMYNNSNQIATIENVGSVPASFRTSNFLTLVGAGGILLRGHAAVSSNIDIQTNGTTSTTPDFRFTSTQNFLIGTSTDIATAIFQTSSTTKYALGDPRMTTVQRDALGTLTEGARVFNLTTHRPNYWDGTSWKESIGVASGGLTNTWIGVGDASGNIGGSPAFTYTNGGVLIKQTNGISGTNALSIKTSSGGFGTGNGVDIQPLGEGSDRWFINGTGDYLTIKTSNKLGLNAASNYVGIGNDQPANSQLRLFYNSNYLGGSTDVGIQSGGNVRLGLYHIGSDVNTPAFTFNSSNSTLSSNTNIAYLDIKHNSVRRMAIMGANGFFVFGSINPASFAHFAPPAISAASWTTNGIGLRIDAATYTNTTGTGTIAAQYAHAIAAPTFASTNAVTITNAATLYVNAPIAGTNTTITTPWAIYGDGAFRMRSATGATLQANGDGSVLIEANNNSSLTLRSASNNGSVVLNTSGGASIQARASGGTTFNNVLSMSREDGTGGTISFAVASASTFGRSRITGLGGSFPDHFIITPNSGLPAGGQRGGHLLLYGGLGGLSGGSGGNLYLTPGLNGGGSDGNVILGYDFLTSAAIGRIGVGTASPVASALLEVSSTTQGFLPPRLTTVQRDAVSSPATALWIYNTTTNRPNYWNGSAWVENPSVVSGGLGNGQVARGDASGNIFSDANMVYTLGATHALSFGTFGTTFQLNFPNSQSGYTRFISANSSGNSFIFGLDNTRLTVDQNGGGITTSQGGTFLRLEAGSHYGDFMKIRSYSGNGYGGGFTGLGTTTPTAIFDINPSNYLYTGDLSGTGYFFRLRSATLTNNTTAASGTVASASLASLDGGTIASTNTGVTYTNAATLRIAGAPVAGTNSSITDSWGIFSNAQVFATRLVLGQNIMYAVGTTPNYRTTANISSYNSNSGGNRAGIASQLHLTTTANSGYGVMGMAASGGIVNAQGAGFFAEVRGNSTNGSSSLLSGTQSLVTTEGGYRMNGNLVDLNLYSTVVGGAQSTELNGVHVRVTDRNNAGSALVRGFYYAGLPSASGSNTGITNHNPLAIAAGVSSGVTNTWSYIDHATTIGSGNQTHASSVLELISTTQGFLPPRMSTAQRDAISSPATGLFLFNTNSTARYQFYTGSAWTDIHSSNYAIVNTNNTQQLGFLQILTSGSAGTTGQGIVVTGADATFQLQGTAAAALASTFTFDTYSASPRGFQNVNPLNSFVQIKGGFTAPNANNLSAAVLSITPTYNVATQTGATVRGVYYNPTLTSMVGVGVHNAWESTSGNIIINGGSVSIGSSTIPSAVAFQVVANNRMTIPAPVMAPSLRDLMTGVQAGMVYSSTSDEYQYFDATGNQFVGIVKKGADAFFTDQAIIYAQNAGGENIVDSDGAFKYNAGTGTMSMLAQYSKINMFREPSDTDLDAAVTVKAYDKSSDANYYVRLLKGVDGVGSGLEDSVQIVMSDGDLLIQAMTKSVFLSSSNGIVSTNGSPFVENRTEHSGSGALQLSGRQNLAFISASATYSSITLPEIVSGTPGLNQVRTGHILQLIIINASSFTINAGAATAIYEHATSTTPVASVSSTGGQTYARTFIAADAGKWVIVGN